jgi:membrane associated rhomboid family serine protease
MAESPEKEELLTRLLHSHRMDISTISHEIRNPLTLIYSTLQMIEASNPEVLNIRHWSDLHSDIEYMKQLLEEVSAGASGAIFGIVGALLYVVVRNHGRVGEISTRGLVLMAGLSLYYGFTAQGVDNAAHIGGLVSGFLLAVLTYWKRKPKHYKKMF